MEVGIVVVAIALVGTALARFTWRRGPDERHSVRDYQHTIDTLRHMSDREGPVQTRSAATDSGRLATDPGRPTAPGKTSRARAQSESRSAARDRTAKTSPSDVEQRDHEQRGQAARPRPTLVFDDVAPTSTREQKRETESVSESSPGVPTKETSPGAVGTGSPPHAAASNGSPAKAGPALNGASSGRKRFGSAERSLRRHPSTGPSTGGSRSALKVLGVAV
ncbi:MAG TPA: hypothetical protein VEJ87_15545, partial [Acidimicrobiales bacterium]|nr:hypothetical protein [Acidimicrobiales bacterium]